MDISWLLQDAAIAGLLAAAAATVVTVLVERWGGLVGGVLGTTPSTIIPAAIAIAAATSNADSVRYTMYTVPLAMGCDVLLLAAWRVLPPCLPEAMSNTKQALVLAAASLVMWVIPATLVWLLMTQWLETLEAVQLSGALALVATAALGLFSSYNLPPTPAGNEAVSVVVLVVRGLGAGLSIFAAVMSAAVSPSLSGLLAAFPAIFLTTMVSVYIAQGRNTTVGAVAPMMLGSTSVSVFALMFAELNPGLGAGVAAVCAYIIAIVGASVPTTIWLRWRQAQNTDFEALEAGGHAEIELEETTADLAATGASV
jgi:hypothetical protein